MPNATDHVCSVTRLQRNLFRETRLPAAIVAVFFVFMCLGWVPRINGDPGLATLVAARSRLRVRHSLRRSLAKSAGQGALEPAAGLRFGDGFEALQAVLASPRPYSGELSGLPVSVGDIVLPNSGQLQQDWLDLGAAEVGSTGAPGHALLANHTTRILGIVTTGDFVESDSCGSGDPVAGCVMSVSFRPTHAGLATGKLLVFTGDQFGSKRTMALGVFETRLVGTGLPPPVPVFAGNIIAGPLTADSLAAPQGVSFGRCFAQPANAEAPTLTGVYVEVVAGPPQQIVLHHSSARAASFDVFCTLAPGMPQQAPPPTAEAVPVLNWLWH